MILIHIRRSLEAWMRVSDYLWVGIDKARTQDVTMCQKIKNRTEVLVGKLIANKILKKLQTHLIVDFITKLPLVAGEYAILVVCNRLFKMAYFVATIEEISAEGLVKLFRDNVWKLYRLLESVISDRDHSLQQI